MNNLKFGIFDIFTYLLPGGVIASFLSFLFAFVFFSRAKMFHEWYYEDGIAAVKTLKLKEKNQDSNH